MNVLSLFDGMSCAMLALNRAGLDVDAYYASEIDKYAIKVSDKNYLNIIRLGDVQHINYQLLPKIDLLVGGSPCQGFSMAGNRLNFSDPRSALFFEFVHALKELKPKYFMLENVSMKKEHQDAISKLMGCEPIKINSALVSAQNRKRLYWTNIPGIEQPEDKGIVLKDILLKDVPDEFFYKEKSIAYMNRGNDKWQQAGKRRADRYQQDENTEKSFCLTANMHKGVPYNYFKCAAMRGRYEDDGSTAQKLEIRKDEKTNTLTTVQKDNIVVSNKYYRKLTPIECERLQTLPDNYTEGVSNTQRYKMIGNGWTVDVIAHIFKHIKE